MYSQIMDKGTFGGLGSHVQLATATVRLARTSNVGQGMQGSFSYEQHQATSNIATPLVVIVGEYAKFLDVRE